MPQIEAILFLASDPLPSRKLARLAHLQDGTAARTMVKQLNHIYESSDRAFRVEEVAGGYQLRTQKIFAPWIRRMVSVPAEIRMSGPAMETLAVVAYRQPVVRTDIEKVRGVQCGEILRQLMDRGMVRISGRAEDLGRPFLYGTTRNFLEVFGLRSLDELPRASMLRATETSHSAIDMSGECEPTLGLSEIKEDGEVRVVDVQDPTRLLDPENEKNNQVPDSIMEGDSDFEEEYEDDDEDDDEDEYEDEETDGDGKEDDDGFNDEEWEEVEDDDVEEQDDDWDEEDDDWDDDEDWDEDD